MRTISLRKFRDGIGELTEPVEVLRRDEAGNYQIIGRWQPLSGGLPPAQGAIVEAVEGVSDMPIHVNRPRLASEPPMYEPPTQAVDVSFRAFRPAPKPGK